MPLYHFNIVDRDRFILDDNGIEFPDDSSAMLESKKAAIDMLHDALLTGDDIAHQIIDVVTEGRQVGQVSLSSVSAGDRPSLGVRHTRES